MARTAEDKAQLERLWNARTPDGLPRYTVAEIAQVMGHTGQWASRCAHADGLTPRGARGKLAGRPPAYSDDTRHAAKRMRQAGLSYRAIARELGINAIDTIRYWERQDGGWGVYAGKGYSPEIRERAEGIFRANRNAAETARQVGVHEATVRHWAASLGWHHAPIAQIHPQARCYECTGRIPAGQTHCACGAPAPYLQQAA